MGQQSTIMKPGVSYSVVCTAANTTYTQQVSPGCRFVRITASAPARLAVGTALVNLTGVNSGIYLPGTTFGPDVFDVEGAQTISAASSAASTIVYITELSA